MMVAFRATAPAHSISRCASSTSPSTMPGLLRADTSFCTRLIGGRLNLRAELVDIRGPDRGLPDYGDLLPGSVHAGAVKRRDVIDGRDIVGREVMRAAASSYRATTFRRRGFKRKSCSPRDARDHPGHRGRNARIGGVREVRVAVDLVAMNLGLERVPRPGRPCRSR